MTTGDAMVAAAELPLPIPPERLSYHAQQASAAPSATAMQGVRKVLF
jgi:hypothetical protein